MTTPYTFTVKSPEEIRDDGLRTLRNGLIERGVADPNVTPGSDFYAEFTAFANELAVVEANALIKADAAMPDTAIGDDLERVCEPYGLSKRPAVGSTGSVIFSATAAATVGTGTELLDPAGLRYAVVTGGTYSNGDLIPIAAVDTGDGTNLAAGVTLRWIVPPAYSASTAEVTTGGLINGADAEGDEELRQRLYARLRTPPRSGNWQHVAELAEASSPAVQRAFVYPAIQGPATLHVAVAAAPTATNKQRAVSAGVVSTSVTPYVQAGLPHHAYSVVTSVTNVNVDMAIGVVLPDATSAGGPGGGWVSAAPWPTVDGSSYYRVKVTAVVASDGTQITVDAQTAPTVGASRVSWISTADWRVRSALVTAVSGTAGAYTITLDAPFTGIATDDLIFPECENQDALLAAVLDFFALMGPGEKSSNAAALILGSRKPLAVNGWVASVGARLLKAVTDTSDDVQAAAFLYRTDGTVTLSGSSGTLTPAVPGSVSSPPNIYVPRRIAFMRQP